MGTVGSGLGILELFSNLRAVILRAVWGPGCPWWLAGSWQGGEDVPKPPEEQMELSHCVTLTFRKAVGEKNQPRRDEHSQLR